MSDKEFDLGYTPDTDLDLDNEDDVIKQQRQKPKSKTPTYLKRIVGLQVATLCLVVIAIVLMLLMHFGVITRQVGLIALVDTPKVGVDIPDWDPSAIEPPNDDRVAKLNEKLEKGKMCISMVSAITFADSSSSGYMNIFNDAMNNYPQFVTIILDSDGSQIYQSGLIEPGKCILYDTLDVELPSGDYECTALFSQVDTETNELCGQAAAKVHVTIKS